MQDINWRGFEQDIVDRRTKIEKAWDTDFEKAQRLQHKYIRKEGDKYIYEEKNGTQIHPEGNKEPEKKDGKWRNDILNKINSLYNFYDKEKMYQQRNFLGQVRNNMPKSKEDLITALKSHKNVDKDHTNDDIINELIDALKK